MNENIINGVGVRLKEERERVGLNKSQLSSMAGCVISTYTNYEDGLREPTASFLINISTNANIDVLYILCGIRLENVTKTNQEASILQCYRMIDKKSQLAVNRLLTTLADVIDSKVYEKSSQLAANDHTNLKVAEPAKPYGEDK